MCVCVCVCVCVCDCCALFLSGTDAGHCECSSGCGVFDRGSLTPSGHGHVYAHRDLQPVKAIWREVYAEVREEGEGEEFS